MLRSVVIISALLLSACQTIDFGSFGSIGGYPSWQPEADAPRLTKALHKDTRPKTPPAYGYEEIGLTAGEFTEFMRQRMWGCDRGCDAPQDFSRYIKSQFASSHIPLNVSTVPSEWYDTTIDIITEMRDRIGIPFRITTDSGTPILFADTTGRDYSCVMAGDGVGFIEIATQHGRDYTIGCLWQEIGHAGGMGIDTLNFGNKHAFVYGFGALPFHPLDFASYWALHDPRIPPQARGNEAHAISNVLHTIATHDLGLPVRR